jgi:hypothetical protein
LELQYIGRSSVSSGVIVFLNNFFFSCRSEFVHSFLVDWIQPTQIQKRMSIYKSIAVFRTNKENKFCWVRLPSLVKINEENCVIPETRHSVCSRHSNDKGKNIVDESVECLCEKSSQSLSKGNLFQTHFVSTVPYT